jgi:hypothetical protein
MALSNGDVISLLFFFLLQKLQKQCELKMYANTGHTTNGRRGGQSVDVSIINVAFPLKITKFHQSKYSPGGANSPL